MRLIDADKLIHDIKCNIICLTQEGKECKDIILKCIEKHPTDLDMEEYEEQIRADERANMLKDICNVLSDEIWDRPKTKDDNMHNHCIKRCIALVKQMEGAAESHD